MKILKYQEREILSNKKSSSKIEKLLVIPLGLLLFLYYPNNVIVTNLKPS